MTRRVLVTGADGFVGGHLHAELVETGLEVISGVSVESVAMPNSLPFDLRDPLSVEGMVSQAAPFDWVVHLAAITFVPDSERSPGAVMDVNLLGTVRLLDAVRKHAPRARVLFVGSSEAYGPPLSLPVAESHALNPANPYAISKAAADQYCGYASMAFGLNIVRTRSFNHSGPGQSSEFVLSSFARQVAEIEAGRREPVLRAGNLDVARDFLHVYDVVRAYRALLEKGRAGEAYNVCSGRSVPLREVLDSLFATSKLEIDVQTDPGRLRKRDNAEVRGSRDKITADTGWEPRLSLDDLLHDLIEYWRKHLTD
jgi:GDP-4-dehydro-6-deoxy-D-mannose reductase